MQLMYMQGKVIDSRNFTQANICIVYTKFLRYRLLNAMFGFILHAPLHVHIYDCVPTALYSEQYNVTSCIYPEYLFTCSFGRASSAILASLCNIFVISLAK